jgi:hypothetical protein
MIEVTPIGTVDAPEEQETSDRSLTRNDDLRIAGGSVPSSKVEGRKEGKFSFKKSR